MSHVGLATLFDYWTADLAADDEQALEEHVFACDACARRLETSGALVRAIPQGIGRRGGIRLCVTRGLLEQLERDGLVLRHYRVRLGDAVQCSVGATDDMLVTWIAGDFDGVERVTVRFFRTPWTACSYPFLIFPWIALFASLCASSGLLYFFSCVCPASPIRP